MIHRVPLRSLRLCVLFFIAAATTTLLAAEHKVGPAKEDKTGIKIGEKAPDFKLKDQNGTERTLGEFLKKGKVALVFYRSADW